MRRPTIIDVAQKAGVSKSTVSLVLQGSAQVKPETRKAVRKAMEEIGYVYNRSAANLRTPGTALIGLVINDLKNPFFTQFATSLQMALASRGYAVVVANTNEEPDVQNQVIGAMLEHGVSALILSPAYGEVADTFDAVERAGIPMLQVLRRNSDQTDLFPFVAPDYHEGGRAATQFLYQSGARRIAFVGGLEGMQVTRERYSGYLEVIEAKGMTPLVLTGRSSRSFGHEAAARLFQEHADCDAAVCFNDLVAFGMINACHEHKKEIGRDFQIIGFDDIQEAAECWPALTSVRCNVDEFGKQVADTVVQWLEDAKMPEPVRRTPVKLIERLTTRPLV